MRPNSAKNDMVVKNNKTLHRPLWSARANDSGENAAFGPTTAELKFLASGNQSGPLLKSNDSPDLRRSSSYRRAQNVYTDPNQSNILSVVRVTSPVKPHI